jgi:hypothetical protein
MKVSRPQLRHDPTAKCGSPAAREGPFTADVTSGDTAQLMGQQLGAQGVEGVFDVLGAWKDPPPHTDPNSDELRKRGVIGTSAWRATDVNAALRTNGHMMDTNGVMRAKMACAAAR